MFSLSLDNWPGGILHCVILLNLLVLKAAVSRGMATWVVLGPSPGRPRAGGAEKREFRVRPQLSAGPSGRREWLVRAAAGTCGRHRGRGARPRGKRSSNGSSSSGVARGAAASEREHAAVARFYFRARR